jgi:methyl-accepting chemotaxis protein
MAMAHAEPLSERPEAGEGPEAVPHDAPSRPLDWAHYFVDRLIAHEKAFESMEKSYTGFRVWVTTIFGIAAAVIAMAGWPIISSAWALQRDLGRMEDNLSSHAASMDKLEKTTEKLSDQMNKMEANLSTSSASMDRLEKSNEKLGDKIDRLSEIINRMQGRLERDGAPAPKGGQ